MTLLDQISEALGASGALGDLSSTIGASASDTDSLVSAGLPAILGGLGAQAGGDGIGALMGLLGDDKGNFADSIGSFFGAGDKTGLASKLIGSLFGSQRSAVESHIASSSGGTMSMVSRVLPMLAPAVMGLLSKITSDDSLDAEAMTEKLGALGTDGPLGEILAAGTDDDRAGFVQGLGALREAGGLGALIPAATAAPVAAAAASVGGGGAAAGAAHDVTAQSFTGGDDDENRNGLGWLPAILLPVLALIAGLVLWQCTSTANEETVSEPEAEVEVVAEAVEEAADEEAEAVEAAPAPEPTATPEPEPTAAPTPEPTAVPVVTIADLVVENPDLSQLVAVAEQLDLVGSLGDPDAGPFTLFAPTNDAFGSAEGVLTRLSPDQTETAVSFHVVPGVFKAADLTPGTTLETLAGETLTVGPDGTLTGGVTVVSADLEAGNGVVHIVENLLVPGSIQRSLASEDVNELFALEPIQFALGSADILPESVPTLDQAIATLTSLPEGTVFEVQGHTDSQGGDVPNQELSEARAASVVAYLTDGGVDADMLVPVGYGEAQLKVDPEVTPEDFATNRRIEFLDIS